MPQTYEKQTKSGANKRKKANQRDTMEKQIIIDGETRTCIKKTFNCSHMQMWRAVHFRLDTDMTRRIQRYAILRGGQMVGCTAAEEKETMRRLGLTDINNEQTFDSNERKYNEKRSSGGQRLN
jgi:hypothetical protein